MQAAEIFERINARDTDAVVRAIEAAPELAAGADVHARETASDTTALHWAAEGGHQDIAQALLAHGADLEARDAWHGLTPLGWATLVDWAPRFRRDRLATLRLLLARGAKLDVFTALALGRRDALAALARADADVLAQRLGFVAQERTPLHVAAGAGLTGSVTQLLDLGADPRAATAWGLTPLALATQSGHTAVRDALRARGIDDDAATALVTGDAGALASRLAPIHACGHPGQRALLFAAAASGRDAAIAPLVQSGADTNATTRYLLNEVPADVTALHLAAEHGHATAISALLAAAAHASPGAATGLPTPLHLAAGGGHLAAVQALLAGGGDCDARDAAFGATPIGWAEHGGHEAVAAVLRAPMRDR